MIRCLRAKVEVSSEEYVDWLKEKGIQIPNLLYKEREKDNKKKLLGKNKPNMRRKRARSKPRYSSTNLSMSKTKLGSYDEGEEDDDMSMYGESSSDLLGGGGGMSSSNLNIGGLSHLNFGAGNGNFGGGGSDDGAGSEESRKSHVSAVSQAFSKFGISEKRSAVNQNALNVGGKRRGSVSDCSSNLFAPKAAEMKIKKERKGELEGGRKSNARRPSMSLEASHSNF